MPKAPRSRQALALERGRILEAACDIICEQGFEQLSMRKLATRVGMTATNLYNYFAGKDEIYLAIQTRGFEELYNRFATAIADHAGPVDRLAACIDAYLDFGRTRKDYYDIMFSWNTPKFADYAGTRLEPQARLEKDAGLNVARLTEQLVRDAAPGMTADEVNYTAMQLWTHLHGVTNLLNSRVLPEVIADPEAYISRLKAQWLSTFKA